MNNLEKLGFDNWFKDKVDLPHEAWAVVHEKAYLNNKTSRINENYTS